MSEFSEGLCPLTKIIWVYLCFTICLTCSDSFVYFLLPPHSPVVFFLKSPAEESISYQTTTTRRLTPVSSACISRCVNWLSACLSRYLCSSLTRCVCVFTRKCVLSIQILHLIDKISITHSWLLTGHSEGACMCVCVLPQYLKHD